MYQFLLIYLYCLKDMAILHDDILIIVFPNYKEMKIKNLYKFYINL
jgi:hypothetical protein